MCCEHSVHTIIFSDFICHLAPGSARGGGKGAELERERERERERVRERERERGFQVLLYRCQSI